MSTRARLALPRRGPALALGLALLLAHPAPVRAQEPSTTQEFLPYPLHTGFHTAAGPRPELVFDQVLRAPGAEWLRVVFEDFELGAASTLLLLSLADDGWQVLDAESLAAWHQASAVFNGAAVRVQLYAAPGDAGVFADVSRLQFGAPLALGLPESLCGRDDKLPFGDDRIGRLFPIPCTTWRATNGAFLTAGHCSQYVTDIVEFRLPPSLPNGVPVAAHPSDQYPVDVATLQFADQGIGNDWSLFSVLPNSNTGLLPHEAYGPGFRVTREAPSPGATIRISGCGLDVDPPGSDGALNGESWTLQTALGPLLGEFDTLAGREFEYQTDTTTGNSGSPIVWEATGLALGVHTHLGCDETVGNHGTSFEHDALELALDHFQGPVVRHVDAHHPLPVSEDGTVFRPFDTVPEAVAAAPDGALISIVAGTYTAAAGNVLTIDRPMTLVAPSGAAVIGE